MSRKKFALRVIKGGFSPASGSVAEELRERGYKVGDLVFADFTKPRNPGFHRLAHALGKLLAENLDAFDGMPAHAVLKRLQWEANAGCDEMAAFVDGAGMVLVRIPKSLSFESMGQDEFYEVYRTLCRHVASRYWRELDADGVADMVEQMMVDE